jgi:hypothetical protein
LSPGIRQVAFTYELPASAFPLNLPVSGSVGVLEVLIQEPTARVQAASLREVPSVNADGKIFRRFLAQDLPPGASLRVEVPRMTVSERQSIYRVVLMAIVALMLAALGATLFRGRRRALGRAAPSSSSAPEPRSRVLVRAIATLDDDFDRSAAGEGSARDEYEATRASLKRELSEALAAERKTP